MNFEPVDSTIMTTGGFTIPSAVYIYRKKKISNYTNIITKYSYTSGAAAEIIELLLYN